MGKSLTRKIIEAHCVSGSMKAGEEVFIKVDQTLTHDINAVMTYLAFEAIGLDRIRTECSVSYLDHNLLYVDHKTPDDHIYLQSAAEHFGVHVSRPGNGICHAVQVSRFGAPGKVSMGGDSHTPHGGSIGMLCIGVGGMDVATAMTGVPMRLKMPRVIKVNLTGALKPGVNAKEVILEMLRRVTIKGGLGNVYEYAGPGAATLEVPQRATITNMGAELGATTSIFPADEQVRKFMKSQKREDEYRELLADQDAEYDEVIDLDLSSLQPLVACPHQPDNVKPLSEVEKLPVQQVFIGSCTNASYADIAKAALVFKGHKVNDNVSCTCAIASRQTYKALMEDGYLGMLMDAGVRILEIACGPCCAIGQTPATEGIAVRTSNRNFKGRAGNPNAKIYLVSPESAAATAIMGTFATAEDITQGLPRVEELFEARKPKGNAIISNIAGKVTIEDSPENANIKIVTVTNEETSDTYKIPFGKRISVNEGDEIEAGTRLIEGNINPHDILRVLGVQATQNYIVKEVQKVYRSQGVEINDKHIEIIVHQMLRKIKIDDPGDSEWLPGQTVDIVAYRVMNEHLEDEGKKPAVGENLLLGTTKAALATDSFLSAASFQETTRVLTEAAIKGKVDPLLGLKENVIIGKLIPAGTGLARYRRLSVQHNAEPRTAETADGKADVQ